MIQHHDKYRHFLLSLGRISNHSIGCYIGYLESVSLSLEKDISPELISSNEAIREILGDLLDKGIAPNHVRNYRTAMGKYLAMTRTGFLCNAQQAIAPPQGTGVMPDGGLVTYEDEFREFAEKGRTPKTVSDYLSDLRRVSDFMKQPLSPELIDSKETIKRIGREMKESGQNPRSVDCCMTAMRTYFRMVREYNLPGDEI